MRRVFKRLLICILICLIINNFFLSGISFAADGRSVVGKTLSMLLGTFVGVLTWPLRVIALAIGFAMDVLTAQLAYSQGAIDANGNIVADTILENNRITPYDILFNKIAIIDINFFNIPNDGSIISTMRMSIAGWYYVMRNIASAILLCVLIYVGIRMAISTVASDKAMYKKMLVDWVCSLALIYLLQYIIIFTFSVNEVLVKAMASIGEQGNLDAAISEIAGISFWGAHTDAIAASIIYCMIVAQTLGLFLSYFNRMLKISFLIIIAPLITLTYSIDKMGDGKAQALNTWLKEFVYTVLIQPFHCIIYISFVSMALNVLNASPRNNLAGSILAILCIRFTKDAEKILGKIFRFGDHASDASLAVGMAASAVALSKAKSLGKDTKKVLNGLKGSKGRIQSGIKKAKVDLATAKNFFKKDENGNKMTLAQAKEAAEIAVTSKEAAKIESKNSKKYGVVSKENSKLQPKDDDEKEEFEKAFSKGNLQKVNEWKEKEKDKYSRYQQYTYQQRLANATAANIKLGMSDNAAAAYARAQVAKEVRKEQKDQKQREKHPRISAARGSLARVGQYINNSETLRVLGEELRETISKGAGWATGSGVYGAGKSAFEAITLGATVTRGLGELLKDTNKTLLNNVSQLLQASGIRDTAGAAIEMGAINAERDNYENADDFVDEIMKQLDSVLTNLDKNKKKTLKNTVKRLTQEEIAKNPLSDNSDISRVLFANSTISDLMKKGGIKQSDIEPVTQETSNFYRRKAIYDTIKQAGNIGIQPDAFIEGSIDRFRKDSFANSISSMSGVATAANEAIAKQIIQDVDAKKKSLEVTEAENWVNALSDQDIQDVERTIENELRQNKADIAEDVALRINESLQRIYDAELKNKVSQLVKEIEIYKDALTTAIDEAAKAEIESKIGFAKSELKQEFDLGQERWKREKKYDDNGTIEMIRNSIIGVL